MRYSLFKNFFLLFPLLLMYCAGENDSSGSYAHVMMLDNTFYPPLSKVPVGGKLNFKNIGNNPHNAIEVSRKWGTDATFGRLEMMRGDKTFVTYPEEGIFPYYCSFHATPDAKLGMVGVVVVGDVPYSPSKKSGDKETNAWSGVTRRVPSQYPTIQNAVDSANPGDLILIANGTYYEEVVVTTPSLIIRGESRSKVIIDGEFVRGNAIMVVGADGVTVENMTVRNATLNGVYWTGVKGYRGSYITAYNNGDYGMYAFSSTDGVMEHSYASGSPDSGFYIGQCDPCRAIIYDVIAENNGLGYSGTNSGGDLYILSSIFQHNVMGVGPNSLDRELLPPEKDTTLLYNFVYDNNNLNAPAKSMEFASIGNGIAIMGGIRNRIEGNIVLGNNNYGISVNPNLDDRFWIGNQNLVKKNIVLASGRADIAQGGPFSAGNCFVGNEHGTSLPPMLQVLQNCHTIRFPLVGELSSSLGFLSYYIHIANGNYKTPNYKSMPVPPEQPEMPEEKFKIIEPALSAYENRKDLIQTAKLPEAAIEALQKYKSAKLGSGYAHKLPFPFFGIVLFFQWFGFYLPIGIYAVWTGTAILDFINGSKKSYWLAILFAFPFLGALLYHFQAKSDLPNKAKISMVSIPLLFFLLFALYTGFGIAKTM